MIFVTHGHVFNNNNLPPIKPGDILLHGHTHVPVFEEYETHIYMNPGSVSIPKENSHHGYIILENRKFTSCELKKLGFTMTDSYANFLFVKKDGDKELEDYVNNHYNNEVRLRYWFVNEVIVCELYKGKLNLL